jgi:tetratricopeptide (TPR) repeat protein
MIEELLKQAADLRRRGESERRRPDTDGGVAAYEQAVAILRTTGDVLKLAHTIRHLGDVHQEQGRPELAAPHYDEALALYRAHPNPPPGDLANVIRSQAVLKEETGANDQAAALWEEARALYAQLKIEEGVVEATRRLARLGR